MKTIINIPSDDEIYVVHVYYDIPSDTFDIEKFRVFAFEYISTYKTCDGQVIGTESQFLSPISLSIICDDEPYEYSGIMAKDGIIRCNSTNYMNIEEFKNYVKQDVSKKNPYLKTRVPI